MFFADAIGHRRRFKGPRLLAGVATIATPPPVEAPADFTVTNWTELNALIGPGASTDLSHKTVLVKGDCSGNAITVTGRTWPGLTLRGSDPAAPAKMPRLAFNNVKGASGSPIMFQSLDFYRVRTAGSGSTIEGLITWDTTDSSYISFDQCKLHDDPFATKSFKGGAILEMYWGFGRKSTGRGLHISVTSCEIYNVVRSIMFDYSSMANNHWHDHYNHAATLIGSYITVKDDRCWNLWANGSDTGNPHAGIGFSPSPSGTGDSVGIVIEGVVALVGNARSLYDGQKGGGSGFKFNDMYITGYRYRDCIVRGCILVGTDGLMIEMDAGTNCIIEGNTIVHDELQSTTTPSIYVNDSRGNIVRNNIVGGYSDGLNGRGPDLKMFNNAYAQPKLTGTTNLMAYSNVFVGPNFSDLTDTAAAIAAFAVKPTHPYANWPIKPGAHANYDYAEKSFIGLQQAPPVSSNATARTQAPRTKGQDVWLKTPTATTGASAWLPTNLRKFTYLFSVANDASIDSANKYLFFMASNSRGYIQRNSTGHWRVNIKDAAGVTLLDATSSAATVAADGIRTILISVDLDQAKVQMTFSGTTGVILDMPLVAALQSGSLDTVVRVLSIGTDQLTTIPGNNFVGQIDAVLIEDDFVDAHTDAGLSRFFNTTGKLVDLGPDGANPFGSTPAIYLPGEAGAAAWNSAAFNLGDGKVTGGAATKFAKNGTGAFL